MGYLHSGHLSLVQRARKLVSERGQVVVSIYVNPSQFGPKEDFSKYPRDLKRDQDLCRQAGVDVVFAPHDREVYPRAPETEYSTYVSETVLSQTMEGRVRPHHFRGVATIVAKLLNIVLPDFAVFGAKDFQQSAVIQRMVRDLNFPCRIITAPTVREQDGLAMSSRNRYLEGDLRTQARVLWRALQEARRVVRQASYHVPAAGLRRRLRKLIESQPAAKLDYIEFFDPQTLQPRRQVGRGVRMALAVRVGSTRLIDNGSL
jgi:pantoate--beta-alanine ligase